MLIHCGRDVVYGGYRRFCDITRIGSAVYRNLNWERFNERFNQQGVALRLGLASLTKSRFKKTAGSDPIIGGSPRRKGEKLVKDLASASDGKAQERIDQKNRVGGSQSACKNARSSSRVRGGAKLRQRQPDRAPANKNQTRGAAPPKSRKRGINDPVAIGASIGKGNFVLGVAHGVFRRKSGGRVHHPYQTQNSLSRGEERAQPSPAG